MAEGEKLWPLRGRAKKTRGFTFESSSYNQAVLGTAFRRRNTTQNISEQFCCGGHFLPSDYMQQVSRLHMGPYQEEHIITMTVKGRKIETCKHSL